MNAKQAEALVWNRAANEVSAMDLSPIDDGLSAVDVRKLEDAQSRCVRYMFKMADKAERVAAQRKERRHG